MRSRKSFSIPENGRCCGTCQKWNQRMQKKIANSRHSCSFSLFVLFRISFSHFRFCPVDNPTGLLSRKWFLLFQSSTCVTVYSSMISLTQVFNAASRLNEQASAFFPDSHLSWRGFHRDDGSGDRFLPLRPFGSRPPLLAIVDHCRSPAFCLFFVWEQHKQIEMRLASLVHHRPPAPGSSHSSCFM